MTFSFPMKSQKRKYCRNQDLDRTHVIYTWSVIFPRRFKTNYYICHRKKDTGVAQLVEHWSPKPGVGRSSRSSRAKAALSGSFFCFKESLWYLQPKFNGYDC